jgi:hypothetical protein
VSATETEEAVASFREQLDAFSDGPIHISLDLQTSLCGEYSTSHQGCDSWGDYFEHGMRFCPSCGRPICRRCRSLAGAP